MWRERGPPGLRCLGRFPGWSSRRRPLSPPGNAGQNELLPTLRSELFYGSRSLLRCHRPFRFLGFLTAFRFNWLPGTPFSCGRLLPCWPRSWRFIHCHLLGGRSFRRDQEGTRGIVGPFQRSGFKVHDELEQWCMVCNRIRKVVDQVETVRLSFYLPRRAPCFIAQHGLKDFPQRRLEMGQGVVLQHGQGLGLPLRGVRWRNGDLVGNGRGRGHRKAPGPVEVSCRRVGKKGHCQEGLHVSPPFPFRDPAPFKKLRPRGLFG